jgi:hypothetical protein
MYRSRVFRAVPLTLVSLAIACGGGAPPTTDAGPITVVDSGEILPDAFVAPDAGDGVCGELPPTMWTRLPASCLPRCTAATATAVGACSSATDQNACVEAAIHADTTPLAHVRYGAYVLDVSCGGSNTAYSCFEWQIYSCDAEHCNAEFNTWSTCQRTGAACTTEQSALDTCRMGSADWHSCLQTRAPDCYAR